MPRPRIDWIAIRRRLDSTIAAFEQKAAPGAEEEKRILETRAAALSRVPQNDTRTEEQLEILEFRLAHERYAVQSSLVREVCPLRELTPLPGTPAFVVGIINVRGQIISVVDLKKFFDLPRQGLTDLNKVVIVGDGQMEFGLLVDAVAGVQRIALSQIQPPLPTLTGIRLEYLRGVTAQRLVILDVARILADPKIIIREDVPA
jgi:purine-binding chemotaxis protein CheW